MALLGKVDPAAVTEAQEITSALYETAGRLRNLKAEYRLAARKDVTFVARQAPSWLAEQSATLATLVGAQGIELAAPDFEAKQGTPAAVTPAGEFFLPLDGLIDVEAEKKRLGKEIEKVEKEVLKAEKKLGNEKFVANAKPEVVEKERERLTEWQGKLAQLQEMRGNLS